MFIDQHNSENRTYTVGLNRFADLTNEEYRSMYLGTRTGHKKRLSKTSDRYAPRVDDSLPDSVDWRKDGAVAEVKDQGGCGNFLLTTKSLTQLIIFVKNINLFPVKQIFRPAPS
ncbi:hypothetical protein OIU76_006296 [Salix suchowensis]|nr:hypothetical protein OIU76_006296 [Salix suchowensis]